MSTQLLGVLLISGRLTHQEKLRAEHGSRPPLHVGRPER